MRLTEEKITKYLMCWLENNDWNILSYDFPQSGTGIAFHPNNKLKESKNKGIVIPDIIAIKNNIVIFMENKNKFVLSDFKKQNNLRESKDYSESISSFLSDYEYSGIFFGVGLPESEEIKKKVTLNEEKIDFAISSNDFGEISIMLDSKSIFN